MILMCDFYTTQILTSTTVLGALVG